MTTKNREIRSFNIGDFETDGTVIKGYAVILNEVAENWGFREVMDKGCLNNTDLTNVSLLINHDRNIVPLARYKQGIDSTMSLRVDEKGLYFEATLDVKNNPDARKVVSAIKRNDLSSMSFAFTIGKSDYKDEIFIIKEIDKIYEISIVTEPAYSGTSVDLRSKQIQQKNKNNTILRGIYNAKKTK